MLSSDIDAAGQWLAAPFQGTWPFLLSRKGCKASEPVAYDPKPAQLRRPNPGYPAWRRHVMLVIRGVAQLARRLKVLIDGECKWMLRATRNSDEVRHPSDKRLPTSTSARRLVRGSPDVVASQDFWPGVKARNRPPAVCPDGEPQAEPPSPQKAPLALKTSLSRMRGLACPAMSITLPPLARPTVARANPCASPGSCRATSA